MRLYKERSLGAWTLGCEIRCVQIFATTHTVYLARHVVCDVIANYSFTLEQLYIAVMRDLGRNASDGIPSWLIEGLVREKFGFDPPASKEDSCNKVFHIL